MFASARTLMLPDDFDDEAITANLKFENCVFSTTFSEYRPGSTEGTFYQPDCCLGVNTSLEDSQSPYYRYNVEFNRCQFFMNSENNKKSMIFLRGYANDKSFYNFNDCLIAYRDGNGTPLDNYSEKVDSMPNGYFIDTQIGSFAEINNCMFYINRSRAEDSSEYGFIMDGYLDDDINKTRCIITSYTEYRSL